LLLAVIIMNSKRGWSLALVPPLIVAFIGLIRFYKLSRQPQFKISEKELYIFNPPKKIEVAKIVAVKSEGKNKMELLVKDDIPIPLFLYYLSSKDRKDLESTIKQIIGQKS
ncbi:MAG: hypothetical protein Q8K77_00420, partial [Thermodesulfovibrionales bacterium]|nr:hypothetical protein [Thermodesulfovibrionales bacterium]